MDDYIIKNIFANKYHFTPSEVDNMEAVQINAFLELEKYRAEKSKFEEMKNKHKNKSTNRKW